MSNNVGTDGRFLFLKKIVSNFLFSRLMGSLIGLICSGKIPRRGGGRLKSRKMLRLG